MSVFIAELSDISGLPKVGADDFLAHPEGGPKKMLDLIDGATPHKPPSVQEILEGCGLLALTKESSSEEVEAVLCTLAKERYAVGLTKWLLLEETAEKYLKGIGHKAASRLLDSVLKSQELAAPAQTDSGTAKGFQLRDDGVYHSDPNGDGEALFICSRLDVLGMTRDPSNRSWGRLVRFEDKDGISKTLVIRMADLQGDAVEVRKQLADAGLIMSTHAKAIDLLRRYITFTNSTERVRTTNRIGWHGSEFVLPDRTISPVGQSADRVLFEGIGASLIKEAGTSEEWRREVGALCTGNSRLMFAVGANFAAPLLDLAGEENGGFHYRGNSTIGKSTALVVGGSVSGGGNKDGFVRSWKATDNGVEGLAMEHNDLCLALDELSQADAKHVGEVVYSLGNGIEKARMRSSGGLRQQRHFRLMFLSTGEVSLADHAKGETRKIRGGQEVRVVDISADAGKGNGIFEDIHGFSSADAFSRCLQNKAKEFYGTPLQDYLRFLVAHKDEISLEIREYRSAFVEKNAPKGAGGEVSRVCGRFGLVAAALVLASKAGVVPWQEDESLWAGECMFKQWLDSRGTTGASDLERAVRQVARFIQAHGTSRFENQEDDKVKVLNRAGFRFKDDDGNWEYWILTEVFRDEVCQGFNASSIAAELKRRAYLETETESRYTYQKRVDGVGRPYFYVINSKILECA